MNLCVLSRKGCREIKTGVLGKSSGERFLLVRRQGVCMKETVEARCDECSFRARGSDEESKRRLIAHMQSEHGKTMMPADAQEHLYRVSTEASE